MGQTPDEIPQPRAERWCGEIAQHDASRVACRLYRTPLGDGVSRLDEGAVLDGCFHCLQAIGVMSLREEAHGAAVQRARGPFGQDVLRYGLKTWCGSERLKAIPHVLVSAEAVIPRVGGNALQVGPSLCPRGGNTRQGERLPGPRCPAPLATNSVLWHWRARTMVGHGAMRALAKAGMCGANVTGIAEGTDVETTTRDTGGGQVPRPVRREDPRGQGHARELTVYGWNGFRLIDAANTLPWAVKSGQRHEPEARWARALVTHARRHGAGDARRHTVVCEQGFGAGTTWWWLDQQGVDLVVPAKPTMAVTADARARAAVGEDRTIGRRVHTIRQGQGRAAWAAHLETAVVGIAGLHTTAHDGSPAPGRQQPRRDVQSLPSNTVVVRQWRGKDDGPGGPTGVLPTASVATPRQPFDDEGERRLSEHGGLTEAKQPWDRGHPPPTTEGEGRVQGLFTQLLFALAIAYRLPCAREARGGALVGWHRWRRQRLEQP
jgi:hypothetical protein